LRAAHDFDPLDVFRLQEREIERTRRTAGIVDGDAVEQHLGLVRIRAAQKDRGDGARPARLHDVEADHVSQHVEHVGLAGLADLFLGDDGHAAADRAGGGRRLIRRDHRTRVQRRGGKRIGLPDDARFRDFGQQRFVGRRLGEQRRRQKSQ
jgi:hypothetical protein